MLCGLWSAHLILEFSGYCRGYGMSLALLATGLLFLLRYASGQKGSDFLLMTVALVFAAAASLTLIPVVIAIIGLALANGIIYTKKSSIFHWGIIIFSLLIAFIGIRFLAGFAATLEEKKLLYYGSNHLVDEFIPSLLNPSLGFSSMVMNWVFAGIAASMMLTVLAVFIQKPLKSIQKPSWLMMAVYMAAVSAVLLLHEIRDTRYPLDRTGIHLLFLFIVAAGFFPFGFGKKIRWSLWVVGPIFMAGAFRVGSTNKQVLWAYEHLEQDAWEAFEEAESNQEEVPIVSGYHMRILTWSWFALHGNAKSSVAYFGDYPSPYADYLLAYPEDLATNNIAESQYNVLYRSSTSQITLYRRKERLRRLSLADTLLLSHQSADEFINLLLPNASELEDKIIAFEISGTIGTAFPSELQIVAMSLDSTSNIEQYHWQPLKWMHKPKNGLIELNTIIYIGKVPKGYKGVKCYLWNINKASVKLEDFKVKLISLEQEIIDAQ